MIPEGDLDRPAAAVSQADAIRLATGWFDLGPDAALHARVLPGEHDANFAIEGRDSRRFVLKVMHPGRPRGLVDLQCAALRHLENAEPALRLPRVVPTRSGQSLVAVPLPGREPGTQADRFVWMLTYIEGTPLAEARPRTESMLASLGRTLGAMDRGLAGFSHPSAERDFHWDLARADRLAASLGSISSPDRRDLAARAFALFESRVTPALADLRRSVIHGDANDYNVLVTPPAATPREVASVIDFGDMHHGLVVAEAAVGATYALLDQANPLQAAIAVVRGYHEAHPLTPAEIDVIFPLIVARLAVSVTTSAMRKAGRPDDPYVTISEAPAWRALEALMQISPSLAHARFRQACGQPVVARAPRVMGWLHRNGARMAPVLDADLRREPCLMLDLSVGSLFLGADPAAAATPALTESVFGAMRGAGVEVGVGRYDEARLLYVSPLFGEAAAVTDERRTIHLGVDLFVPPGSPVRAPLPGVVHLLANNDAPQDYGPLVVLEHRTDDGDAFFTLYGHLSDDTLQGLRDGQRVEAGEEIARVGAPPSNGGWAPHVHFQIMLDLLELGRDFPGVCRDSERPFWTEVSPDPNLMLGIPAERLGKPRADRAASLERRGRLLGFNQALSYERPLRIVRGFGTHLYDETGRAFLDLYNNVPLVGHSHPRVVRAVQEQIALLNTNTRYLHDAPLDYAERLIALLPAPLRVCFFVNSGSEANDLALRMARVHTGREDVIVLEHAYHGHTQALIDVSPYKFDGPGGSGRKPFVRIAPMPDDYAGACRRDDPEAGRKYGRMVGALAEEMRSSGRGPAAFIAETFPSVGGQIVPPPGYLAEAYAGVRAAGGLCIADEVQVGFGRLGSHFWGFAAQGVTPDMVVLGKPMGNGFPLAAVVTTEAIARSFANGMEFFSTFGGNPVACAAGLAVLDVVRDLGLQSRALDVGDRLLRGLRDLMSRHALIGDVRGSGLFLGVELVRDRELRTAAPRQADYVVNRLRERGVLTGTDGPRRNVLKLRPPLVLSEQEADHFVAILDDVLGDDAARPD